MRRPAMTKCYTVNGVGFYIQEQPQHKALEQAIEYARRVNSKVLDADSEQVWPIWPMDEAEPTKADVCPKCGGWGGGAWNGNDSPFEGYLPCYACGL